MKKIKRGAKNIDKKGQLMGMPFQFIFALILVAVAIFVGFYVIKMFLDRAEQANINDFVKNQLQYEIENVWLGPSDAQITRTLILSNNFGYICFFNQSKHSCSSSDVPSFCSEYELYTRTDKDNLFLIGKDGQMGKAEKYDTYTSWHIACGTTTKKDCFTWPQQKNPLCIPVSNGKVTIKLTKQSGQNYVTISQPS